jgi:hypothetical protein
MKTPFKYDSHTFRTENELIEDEVEEFVKSFRKNRKETFEITEHVLDSEELGDFLNRKSR